MHKFLMTTALMPALLSGQAYIFSTLNDPAGTLGTVPMAINDAGSVVGYYTYAIGYSGVGQDGFMYANGAFTTLHDPSTGASNPGQCSGRCSANGINNNGQIVGGYIDNGNGEPGSGNLHGYLYQNGTFQDVNDPNATVWGTVANGINNAGQIVGYDSGSTGYADGFFDSGGSFTEINAPNAAGNQGGTHVNAVNSAGAAVGWYVDSSGESHGFLYIGGEVTVLDDPNADSRYGTLAQGINDLGQVVGYYLTYSTDYGQVSHAFVYSSGEFTDINVPGAQQSAAYGINNSGIIVGAYSTGPYLNSTMQGFIATPLVALSFVPVTPCRAVDTRNPDGPLGGPSITGGTSRTFAIAGNVCGIPSDAAALSVNAAIVPTSNGYMTLWPAGQAQPGTASVNSPDGGVHSNGAIVPVGAGGALSAFAYDTMDVVLDVSGYFVPTSGNNPNALAFYPLTPCRVADTRDADGDLGGPFMAGGSTRTFPIQEAATMCGISAAAQAYSLNLAVAPRTGVFHYLTAWPSGQAQPQVSSLNDPQAVNHSSGAIVPADTGGGIDVYVTNDTDVILDINGYFAPPATGGLSLYALQPCRALDTRNPAGSPPFTGTITVNVETSDCGAPGTAQAYVFNATVVPQSGSHGYLTLWQQGAAQPTAANLNDPDGVTTGNLAIVPTTNGAINAYFFGTGYLVLDLFGYFAP